MPQIIPISDLRNKANKVVELCQHGEPVFVTRHGAGELVVMSESVYERMQARLELYERLEEAEGYARRGVKGRRHAEVMRSLSARLR